MYFEEFLKHDTDDLAVGNLIQIHLIEGNRDKAAEVYENSEKGFYPSKVFGNLLLQMRDIASAKHYFKRAVELVPGDKDIMFLYKECMTLRELAEQGE